MNLLMNKLDELDEGTQDVHDARFPHPDEADAELEPSTVSQEEFAHKGRAVVVA